MRRAVRTGIDPVDPHAADGITNADAHAARCAHRLAAYADALAAPPA